MRERLNAKKFDLLFSQWQESGLPVKDFCENLGMSRQNWYKWCKKLNKLPYDQETVSELVSISFPFQSESMESPSTHVFNTSQESLDRHHYTKSSLIAQNATDTSINNSASDISKAATIEFTFPNGTKMMLRDSFDLDLLKKIIHLYD